MFIHVALPDSLLMEDRELRDKTVKLGFIARALAIYRVERIFIFKDPVENLHERETKFIAEMLEYAETPPYLRKKLYALKPELKYAGLMPPLKIPSHKKKPVIVPGEFREGIVEHSGSDRSVFVGVERNLRFEGSAKEGSRVTVRIEKDEKEYFARQVSKKEVNDYWGYVVKNEKNILQLCKTYDLSLITSRLGQKIEEVWSQLRNHLKSSPGLLVVFGAPKRGLLEMYRREDWLNASEFILNTIPYQGVETVRTEEALLATLQTLALLKHMK